MLQVKVIRKVRRPYPQRHEEVVTVHGFDRLTPRAARAALEIAFGQPYGGEVWTMPESTPEGLVYDGVYGYRVYPSTATKLYPCF